MKIKETIENMSKMYLRRIVKSFTTEYPRKDADVYREEINMNIEDICDEDKIKLRFKKIRSDNEDPYSGKILNTLIIKSLLGRKDCLATEDEIVKDVKNAEKEIIELSQKKKNFKHMDDKAEEIFETVLETALEDYIISEDELNLISKLRKKLNINEQDQYLIQAKLKLFPKEGNKIHSYREIHEAIHDIQKAGIIFYCNKPESHNESFFVIPEEIIPGIKKVLNIELIEKKYLLLLRKLRKAQLKIILSSKNLNQYGKKEDLINRILLAMIPPSSALNTLPRKDLYNLCSKLSGVNVSGTKKKKIDRILNYYSNLVIKKVPKDDPRRIYYEYLEELAMRDEKNLLGNEVIQKGKDISKYFEQGTRYLFEKKLCKKLVKFSGTEHPDGCVTLKDTGDLLGWDNKSKIETYTFPDKHRRQFRRYIRNINSGEERITCFLIIAPKIDKIAAKNAYLLKKESGTDTDVALISAEDLKIVAENWKKYSDKSEFNLEVLNYTGILDHEKLKERMNWLL